MKKLIALLCTAVMLCTTILPVTADDNPDVIPGNTRPAVVRDAVHIFMHLAKMHTLPVEPYDFNENDRIDVGDAVKIFMGLAKMIEPCTFDETPVPCDCGDCEECNPPTASCGFCGNCEICNPPYCPAFSPWFLNLCGICIYCDPPEDCGNCGDCDYCERTKDYKPFADPSNPMYMSSAEISAKLAELREIDENTDYTGMWQKQIYVAIETRYLEAFGNLFWIANSSFCSIPLCWYDIRFQFYNELIKYDIDLIWETLSRLTRGYLEMTVEEIETAIIGKYKGKDSLFDQMAMFAELEKADVFRWKIGHHEGENDISFKFMTSMYSGIIYALALDYESRTYTYHDDGRISYYITADTVLERMSKKTDFLGNEFKASITDYIDNQRNTLSEMFGNDYLYEWEEKYGGVGHSISWYQKPLFQDYIDYLLDKIKEING